MKTADDLLTITALPWVVSRQPQRTRPPAAVKPASRAEVPVEVDADDGLEVLLQAAREGDAEALGCLYDRYSPGVYRYLCRRVSDPETASDLTAAVFVRVLEAIHGRNAWRESFTGWLYRIAHNQLVDYRRAQARQPQAELHEDIPCQRGAAMEDEAARSLLADDLRTALSQLRPAYATVLDLRFGEGLSHAEVGAILGKSRDTVKVTQFRALTALRRQLANSRAFRDV